MLDEDTRDKLLASFASDASDAQNNLFVNDEDIHIEHMADKNDAQISDERRESGSKVNYFDRMGSDGSIKKILDRR